MKKQILSIVIITILIILAGIWFGTKDTKNENTNVFSTLVPNTPFFLQIKDFPEFYNKMGPGNPLYEDLKSLFPNHDIFPGGLDSITPLLKNLQLLSNNKGGVLALQSAGANKLDFLISVANPDGYEVDDILQFFEGNPSFKKGSLKSYEGSRVQEVVIDSLSSFISCPSGLLIWSKSEILVQNALRHLQTGISAWDGKEFHKLQKTSGAFSDANSFFHPNSIHSEFQFPFSNFGKGKQFWLKNFANLMSADLTIRPNEILWNGFAYASDTLHTALGAFKGQKPRPLSLIKNLPASTVYFKYFGVSDPALFLNKTLEHKRFLNPGYSMEKWMTEWKKHDKRPLVETVKDWLGSEWVVFCTNPGKQNIKDHFFAVFELKNPSEFKEWIEKHGEKTKALNQKNDQVIHLKTKNFFYHLFGENFSSFEDPEILVKENHLYVFNNRTEMLRNLASLNAGIHLKESPVFKSFQNNVSSQSNLLVYCAPGSSLDFIMPYLNSELKSKIKNNQKAVENIESAGWQFSFSKNSLYYFNAFIRHNPFRQNQPFALWEHQLDTSVIWGPHYFENHYSGNQEIAVQDANHQLHLFGTTGNKLWSLPIGSPVMGGMHQVDAFKNGKYQILVHSADKLFLIDRLGRMVEKSPVVLPAQATGPAGVFDYEKQKEYRIVLPTTKGLLNFNVFGQKIEGWKTNTIEEQIQNQPQHIRIRNRDYILALGVSGKPYILSRKGTIRQETEFNITDFKPSHKWQVFQGKTILESGVSYRDANGFLRQHKFNGRNDKVFEFEVKNNWVQGDFNRDGKMDFLVQTNQAIFRKFSGETERKIREISSKNWLNPHILEMDGKGKMAILTPEKNKIEFFNLMGESIDTPPLMGATPFTTRQLFNNGGLGFSTSDGKKTISTYVLN